MRFYFPPGLLFVISIVASLALVAWVVFIAVSQPWLGIGLDLKDGSIVVSQVDGRGALQPQILGQRLVSLAGAQQGPAPLAAIDLIEETDMIGDVAQLKAFYAQQERLFQGLASGEVGLGLSSTGGQQGLVLADVQQSRPIVSLPLKFWTQLLVGFIGLVIGTWVACLRPKDLAAWMVLLTGIGLALSSGSAALYSTREIALSYDVFTTASRINSIGTLVFGIGMMTLFLVYPRVIVPRTLVALPALAITGQILFIQAVDWPRYVGSLQTAVAAIMLALLIAIAAQVIVNRRDPAARAMLGWLGLSVASGAGGFVLTVSVPTLLGQEIWLEQSTAFLFSLLIYAGIALGVARYRLFDLASWSFGILFYGFGVALLLLLDAGLIYGLSVERAPAFGIALAAIGGIYLPLRRNTAQWLMRKKLMPAEELYRRITDISHAMDPSQKLAVLRMLWEDLFSPLSITALPAQPHPMRAGQETYLNENGSAMVIAPVLGLPGLRLEWAAQGTRLFSTQDLLRAKSINAFIDTSLRQNQTYLEAVDTERSRINRDMHDNIGVLLVSALHVDNLDRKDALIRQTLTDLREIISNPD